MAHPENILKQISLLEEEKEDILKKEKRNINRINKINFIDKKIKELENIMNNEFEYISNSIKNKNL